MPKIIALLPAPADFRLVFAVPQVHPPTGKPMEPQLRYVRPHALALLANGSADYLVADRRDPRDLVAASEDELYLGIADPGAPLEVQFRKLANAACKYTPEEPAK